MSKATFNWNVFDHKWNNFKRWAYAMAKKKDKPVMLVSDLIRMIETCDKAQDELDDMMIKVLLGE